MENPIKMDDLGVFPLFLETPISLQLLFPFLIFFLSTPASCLDWILGSSSAEDLRPEADDTSCHSRPSWPHRTTELPINRKPMSGSTRIQGGHHLSLSRPIQATVAMDTEVMAYLVASLLVELVVLAFWKHMAMESSQRFKRHSYSGTPKINSK